MCIKVVLISFVAPLRSSYQRLGICLKSCWQHRDLRGRERFQEVRLVWIKQSSARTGDSLGGDSTPQREMLNACSFTSSLHTCWVFLQLRFGGLKDSISTHCWLGDHSQVLSSDDRLHSCFLVHLYIQADRENIKHPEWFTLKLHFNLMKKYFSVSHV